MSTARGNHSEAPSQLAIMARPAGRTALSEGRGQVIASTGSTMSMNTGGESGIGLDGSRRWFA